MLSLTDQKRLQLEQLLYTTAFCLNLWIMMICDSKWISRFSFRESSIIVNVILYTCIGLLITKLIVHNRYPLKDLLIKGSMLFLGFISVKYYGWTTFLIFLLIVSADNIEFSKLMKYSLIMMTIMGIFIVLSAKFGYIENLIYYREGKIRESFGFVYVTVFASYIFYIFTLYLYLKKKKINMIDIGISLVIIFLLTNRCDARLSVVSVLLMISFMWISDYFPHLLENKLIKMVIKNSYWIFSGLIILLSYKYVPTGWIGELNRVMAGRLSLGYQTFQTYPIKLFGQKVIQNGLGGSVTHDITQKYYYIDSSYLRLLFMYGLVLFIVYGLIFYAIYRKAYKNKDYRLIMVIFVISITAMIDENMIRTLNVFILYLFALPRVNYSKKKEV